MSEITFVIPTNNRAADLEVCVRSIATQIRSDMKARIVVLNDGSTDDTRKVLDDLCAFYPFIEARHMEKHDDYSDVFRTMFRAVPDSEWVWTFGDDDKLIPGALEFMDKQLDASPKVDFFHIAELSRASGGSGAYKGTLLDLCRNFGWIDMTGFITGNIVRGDLLCNAATTPRWTEYAKTSFVQSCALLERLQGSQAVFLDLPLIATQHEEMTAETIARWARGRIAARYLLLSRSLERMYDDGVLTTRQPAKFFRYLQYHLWDRFINFMSQDYLDKGQMWHEDSWSDIARFAQFVEEDDVAEAIRKDADNARGIINLHNYMKQNLDNLMGVLTEIRTRRAADIYPFSFATAPTRSPPSTQV